VSAKLVRTRISLGAGIAALARHGARLPPGRTAVLLTGAGTT
jgi:hypothetical protein